jgi:hypothetical protein
MNTLNPFDTIIVTAFIQALAKLEAPLPHDLQAQLHQIGTTFPAQADQLHSLADQHPPLRDAYQAAHLELQRNTAECLAGPKEELDDPNEQGKVTVIQNTMTRVPEILISPDPVGTAREVLKPQERNLFQRLFHRKP